MSIAIQPYSNAYEQEVIDLILSIQRTEFGVPITAEQQPDLKMIPEFYQKGNGNFWMALHKGKVVGTIALIDIGNAQVALRKMFVDACFRGKEFKTGQALLDVSVHWMREKKVTHVFLGTLDIFKAAQSFYRRNEFTELPAENLPSSFPRMKLDNMFFEKEISSCSIDILGYQPEHQPWFEKFNRAWIEQHFWMEPVDFDVLQQPEPHILKKGGFIFMAQYEREFAGTVALKKVTEHVYEFTKMAVDEKFRGKKIGEALALAAIRKAKEVKAEKIILYSNTKLAPAIALYKKLGFNEVELDASYKRSDIKMELVLTYVHELV